MVSLLEAYREERIVELTYDIFGSGVELVEAAGKRSYDVLLLDVMMPGFTGMEAAAEIRGFDTRVKIVFLTSSTEFAVESYRVKAYTYLLKPARRERMFELLDELFTDEELRAEGLSLKSRDGVSLLPFSRLYYVEVLNKVLFFHTADGVKEVAAPLSEFEPALLARPEFLRVHRSYIVNLRLMRELGADGFITLSGELVPVSRRLAASAKEAFMRELFSEGGDR